MGTLADFWIGVHGADVARWRTARKTTHRCARQAPTYDRVLDTVVVRCPAGPNGPAVAIGDRYFDTGEVVDQWRTSKLCAECAVTELDS